MLIFPSHLFSLFQTAPHFLQVFFLSDLILIVEEYKGTVGLARAVLPNSLSSYWDT